MPDFLHSDAIAAALAEVTTAAQQGQVTLAAANEMIANVNELVLKAIVILEAVSKAGK